MSDRNHHKRKKPERHSGPPCPHYPDKFKTEAAHIARNESRKRYHERQVARQGIRTFGSDGYPLRLRLQKLLAAIKQRCRVRPTYAGIQCDLTYDQLLFMWNRDCADNLERPSIDRIDNDGNYTFPNCRFIEHADNVRRGVQVREAKKQEKAA